MKEMTNEFEALQFIEELKNEFERKLGSLRVTQGSKTITLPLDSVDIKANVVGRITEVTLTQVFKNPYAEHLEAEYIFPLAGCSSVNGFKMHVGGRTVIGTIQERRAAREQYQQALQDGKRASLLEQERDDVFTMQVGNIPPNELITVELTYTEKLEFFEDGTTELRLPLVVAPRYVPGNPVAREQVGDGVSHDTDQVPDASRVTPPRLAPGLNPDVSLSISVEITPELSPDRDGQNCRISDLSCSQHAVQNRTVDGVIHVTLAKANELLNRDFILKWKSVSEQMTSSVVLYTKAGGDAEEQGEAYGMLSLVPPAAAGVGTVARDVIFVLDRSGSMSGQKMVSAARACSILLSTLGPNDRFAINAFDHGCEWYRAPGRSCKPRVFFNATVGDIEQGTQFLKGVTARGGTELLGALKQSLELVAEHQEKGRIPVIVVLTDGQVSDESHIFKLVQQTGRDTRIFTIGIDTALNSPMLKRIASLSGGTSTSVVPGEQLEDALVSIGREIGSPLVTDLRIESLTPGVSIDSLAPGRIPDLFLGRTSDCMFKVAFGKQAQGKARFRIKGKFANGRKFSHDLDARALDQESVSRLWAREYIKELEDQFRIHPAKQEQLKQRIVELSLDFSVLTRFTAFVAVDDAEVVNTTGQVRHVVQPVHTPDQWESLTTAQPAKGAKASRMKMCKSGGIDEGFFDQGTTGSGLFGMAQQSDIDFGQASQSGWGAAGGMTWGAPSQMYGAAPSGGFDQPTLAESIRNKINESAGAPSMGSMNVPPPPAAPAPGSQPPSGWNSLLPPPSMGSNKRLSPDESNTNLPASSIWSTMKKLFGSANEPPVQPPGAPINRLINALKAFRVAWMSSWLEVGKGCVPNADKVETARKELVEALADHPVGFEVPLIQKFLRSSAIEYVAALQATDVTAWALYKSRTRFHDGFVDAMVEAEAGMLQLQGRQGAFWETNV